MTEEKYGWPEFNPPAEAESLEETYARVEAVTVSRIANDLIVDIRETSARLDITYQTDFHYELMEEANKARTLDDLYPVLEKWHGDIAESIVVWLRDAIRLGVAG